MARQPRNEFAPGRYHVVARGVNRLRIFADREDYEHYIRLLAKVTERHGWVLLSFCLMPNHVHLFIETTEPNLGLGMQWLHSMYARHVNGRHSRVGHLFQGRFRATSVTGEVHFITVAAYVELNAVRAGLAQRPEEWPWSSAGLREAGLRPSWLAHEALCERLRAITGHDDFLGPILL